MIVVDLALLALAAGFLAALARVIVGPSVADRAVAADVCFYAVVAALALLSVRLEAPALLDAVLIATMLGFIATISLARLVRRKK
ncbi:MAG: monovalent cation/H+ antiporter complex subunit F [Thermoleophilia bacterium]|jgi:multicomponent Na+:H+ antiporter subunit F|nr:monovalent cation/H+ antiporter complex subunit F [Thermoleophilia bacterium]